MVVNYPEPHILPEAYLAAEAESLVKHEYVDGFVYQMAGASDAHVTISGNLFALLRNHLRGTGCRVFISDMKVRIEAKNIYYYPDLMVTCDDRDRAFSNFKQYPCLIVEVLSDSTEAFDRGNKFADYQQLEHLQEYLLISQSQQRADFFCRNAQGQWLLQFLYPGDQLYLVSINFRTQIEVLYEDVVLASDADGDSPAERLC